jgi:hypothetical protein
VIKFFVYLHRRFDNGEVFYIGKGTWTEKKKYIRAATTSKRNIHWERVVAKAGGFTHEVIAEFDDEYLAFEKEISLINDFGRNNDGGCLCNMTLGGEGHYGLKQSPESVAKRAEKIKGTVRTQAEKDAVSRAQRGVPNSVEQSLQHSKRMRGEGNPWYGTKHSPERLAKMAKSMTGKLAGEKHPFYGKKRPEVSAKLSGGNSYKAKRVVDRATGQEFPCATHAAAAFGVARSTLSKWLLGHRKNPTSLEFA